MQIGVIGTGYVGLVSGVCFAELGFSVQCIDKDEEKITALKAGKIPIYEPNLAKIMQDNYQAGRLKFSTKCDIADCDIVFLAVGTPAMEGGRSNLQYIFTAAQDVAQNIQGYTLIVTKSTVPVGTGERIRKIIANITDAEFDISSNPEFLREGSAVNDFMNPDRIIIGLNSERAKEFMQNLYANFKDIPLIFTNIETAEMAKYAANSFLAMKVAFINEMADICEKIGANIEEIAHAVGLDNRIDQKFLQAGPGFGGSCFPKDINALINISKDNGLTSHIIESVIKSNQLRKINMADKISQIMGKVENKNIAIFGVAFKAETDDIRDSPAIDIITKLNQEGASLHIYDPKALDNAMKFFRNIDVDMQNITPYKTALNAAENADCIVVITEWQEFREINISRLKSTLKQPIIIDLRNLYDPQKMQGLGIEYYSVGR